MMTLTRQIRRFILTGLVNTAVGYLTYAFGILALRLPYAGALLFSYALGVTFSFFTFRAYVFTGSARGWKSYLRFVPTYVVLLFINLGLLHLLVDVRGWGALAAQAVVVPVCAALSFVINRVFVFA